MKNIHILPTDKPSRLYLTTKEYIFEKEYSLSTDECQNKHIYITSDEEIKEGVDQWYLDKFLNKPRNSSGSQYGEKQNVIILTTDQDLIKDGVQSIDDEFLEWFVKNPSCDRVEVAKMLYTVGSNHKGNRFNNYKIIIPKEEAMNMKEEFEKSVNIITDWLEKNGDPVADKQVEQEAKELFKQETLEEFAKQEAIKQYSEDTFGNLIVRKSIEKGAKWQQERMYSEEELLLFGKSCFYKGFEKAKKDDANCFTAFREEIGSLVKKFKNK